MASEKRKKPFFKKWWFWVLVVIVIIAFANIGGGDDSPKTVDKSTSTKSIKTAKKDSKKEETSKEVFNVGEAVKMGDNVLTVTKVEKSNGNEFDKPQQGKEFVIVTVQIENDGKDNISYNPFDFKMANSQGQITDQTFTTINNDTALQSGELAPKGKVSGTIAFEMPTGDTALQLQYTASFWSDKKIKVNLQ
ncbi:hypothetical protein BLX88_04085 [Bacillus obstructivus]|nr:hypothetical protein BLX88_04085 [Bacillus obstructivus]